ncbi:MAG TPA: hypothetical protein VLH84_04275 [Patescibacteria group bacterium]|nr:hypothetical protein [Patescibacteria group bacterium]
MENKYGECHDDRTYEDAGVDPDEVRWLRDRASDGNYTNQDAAQRELDRLNNQAIAGQGEIFG